jgi:hypothetical protein
MHKEPKALSRNPDALEEIVEQAVERQYAKKMVRPDPEQLSERIDPKDATEGA